MLELKKEKTIGKEDKEIAEKYLNTFTAQINDDLNTPQALATMWEMLGDAQLSGNAKYNLLLKFDEVLGLGLANVKEEKVKIPSLVQKLAEERELARKNKDWKTSDELREKIKELGYVVGDTKEGYVVSKV